MTGCMNVAKSVLKISARGKLPLERGSKGSLPSLEAVAGQDKSLMGITEREEDFERVRRAQKGDLKAYEQLVQRHERKAYGLAFSLMGNREDAEDMLQESFFQAFQALQKFRGESSFQTWFYRILINRCRSEKRKKTWRRWFTREEKEEKMIEEQVWVEETPRDQASLSELSKRIGEAVEALPPGQRLVFTMKALQGMKVSDIAEVLYLRPGTVKAHLFQATRKMQRSLNGYL